MTQNLELLTDNVKELANELLENLPKVLKGNKSAAKRVRKALLDLEKVGKDFRKASVADLK